MEVNITTTNAIIKELEGQRNDALTRCAKMAGEHAALQVALQASQARVKELEEASAKEAAKAVAELERDAA